MEVHRESNRNGDEGPSPRTGVNRWLVVGVAGLLAVAGLAFGYGYRQQLLVNHLRAQEMSTQAAMNQMQNQVNTLTAKLTEMTAAQQAVAEARASKNTLTGPPGTKQAAGKTSTAASKRLRALQARIDQQQKQLKETQDEVAKNREELERSLHSTRDELNGSIAKTHEELVVLQKRGERNYFEFELTKSKQFQRIGPLTLSLRRVDAKHKNYDLQLIIEDSQVSKKRVNIYEPIWIHTENESQPVQVVVNRVEKNLVHGYISAPKYKPSELVSTASSISLTPVSAHGSAAAPDSSKPPQEPKPQQQPEQPPLQ